MRMIAFLLSFILSCSSWSQLAIGPEFSLLNQKNPTPIAVGGGLRALYPIGKNWMITSTVNAALAQREKVDGTFGDPTGRQRAAGVPHQYRIGENLHQRFFAVLGAEWRSKIRSFDRSSSFAVGLGAGVLQYRFETDHMATYFETGETRHVTYTFTDHKFILLPYAGWRTPLLNGEFFADVGAMLPSLRRLTKDLLPILRTGIIWQLSR